MRHGKHRHSRREHPPSRSKLSQRDRIDRVPQMKKPTFMRVVPDDLAEKIAVPDALIEKFIKVLEPIESADVISAGCKIDQ